MVQADKRAWSDNMLISHYVDGCLKLPRVSPGPDLFPSSCAGLSLSLSRVTLFCRILHPGWLTLLGMHSGFLDLKIDRVESQVIPSGILREIKSLRRNWGHQIALGTEISSMTGRWSEKQWMLAQTFSTITQEKGNTSKGGFSSVGRKLPLTSVQRRVIEAWTPAELIPVSCPWAWQALEAWLYVCFSLSLSLHFWLSCTQQITPGNTFLEHHIRGIMQ